ncbi:MAG: AzlC family ABC transporter permease [Firmicutes bacterium]|nr:AzlC family ABC transporter permease [Bacillota bacterium]
MSGILSRAVAETSTGPKLRRGWPESARVRFWLGVRAAWPVVTGYVPVGLALGVLAAQEGLGPFATGAMSLFVYAGASQFIAVGMIGAQAAALSIVLTTFFINLRHLLMSAAISPYLRGLKSWTLAALAFLLTDETFGVASAEFSRRGRGDPVYFTGLGLTAYGTWCAATVIGAWAGQGLASPEALGLDFALKAMFIGLLAGQLRGESMVRGAVAVLAGAGALAAAPYLGGFSVMAAAAAAAAVGVVIARWMDESS